MAQPTDGTAARTSLERLGLMNQDQKINDDAERRRTINMQRRRQACSLSGTGKGPFKLRLIKPLVKPPGKDATDNGLRSVKF